MKRSLATSVLLLTTAIAARTIGGVQLAFQPFESAVSVLGSLVLFLALLIMSSRHYRPEGRRDWRSGDGWLTRHYVQMNLAMIFAMCICELLGHVLGMAGLANTATTFLVLWLMEKYVEVHLEAKWNGWLLTLIVSLVAWRTALWLHTHPTFVISMFSSLS